VLTRVWTIKGPLPLLYPDTEGALPNARQAKVEPVTSACRAMDVEVLLQIDEVVTALVITGRGLTVSTTGRVAPGGQLFAVGVTW